MNKEVITIDVVSDVACPWCYVGKRNLEAALKAWKGTEVEVNWHPFQLDPTIPNEGLDGNTYLANKFGSSAQIKGMTNRLAEVGKEVGINFDFDSEWTAINTLQLHQLLHVAGEEGFKNELKERFLHTYFEERVPMNDNNLLKEIMAEYGWSAEKVDEVLNSDEIAFAVKGEIAHYQQLGVSGVPFFIINNKYAINGAQPSHVFLEVFQTVEQPVEVASGESCDPITGEC